METNLISIPSSIPGLAQWVKNPALPKAVEVADAAQIWHGCGVRPWLPLLIGALAGEPPCAVGVGLKKKKKKKKKKKGKQEAKHQELVVTWLWKAEKREK